MVAVIVHERTAWNDYFTGTPTLLQKTEYTSRENPSYSSLYVLNCLFRSIESSSDGGALYCYNSVTYFLVELTSFFSCKTSGGGGAIYFYNTNSQSVLYKICGYDCCTTNSNNYQFAYITVKNEISSKNYVNYSSVIRCVNENSTPYHMLSLFNGKICCPSVNMSMNKCYRLSGIGCWPLIESNSFTCLLTHSSFTDSHATGYDCIYFNAGGASYEIKSCNILRNTQVTLDSDGIIYVRGNLKIEDSCILENTATRIFHQVSSSYTITLINCTVDSTSNNGCLTVRNSVTKSFILALNHMSTQNCHSEYDSAGNLTPNLQTPSSSKKPKLCYTYMKCLCQSPTPQIFQFFVSFYISI
jgi:hypothetical protein